jgi:hypothetical protein
MKKVLLKMFIMDLTPGKVYDVISTKDVDCGKLGFVTTYLVVNDDGEENYYSESFFRDLRVDELREEKLKELGL